MSHLPRQMIVPCAALILLLASPAAKAETCADKACPTGFSCQEVKTPCAAAPPCESGQECPEPEPCETETEAICVPSECSSDADCGGQLSCVTFTTEVCEDVAVACAEGEDCSDVNSDDASCEEDSESFCAPAYIAPCQQDSDCGEGFTCQAEEICYCSGSTGSAGADDSADPDGAADVDDESCGCEPSDQKSCELVEKSCEQDADCPDQWTCEEQEVAVACSVSSDDSEPVCDPEPEAESHCVPPLWGSWGASDGNYESALDKAANGELADQLPTDDSNKADADSGGCAVATTTNAGAALPLLLLGLALLARRRKQD